MRGPHRLRLWILLVALPAVVLGVAAFVLWRAQHALDQAKSTVAQRGRFEATLRPWEAKGNPGFESIASPPEYVAGAFYQGKLYLCGAAGLSILGADGMLLKRYLVGVDLPAANLTAMAVGRLRGTSEPELMIATAGAGVLFFTGSHSPDGAGAFSQLQAKDADARNVTALLPLATGELLLGTKALGVLVYRGLDGSNSLESFQPGLTGLAVTALAADAAGIWVGTHNEGVRHWHGGELESFGPRNGSATTGVSSGELPDAQVESIAVHGDKAYVGTPLGVEEFDNGRPSRTLAANFFAHALYADDQSLTISSIDQGVSRIALKVERRPHVALADFSKAGSLAPETIEQFLPSRTGGAGNGEEALFAVTRSGLQRLTRDGGWTPVMARSAVKPAMLSNGNVSALAFGADGRLWVGFFDRGLDVFSADWQRVEHHEDDPLFCVNRIALDPGRRTMAVATANGLVLFDAQSEPRQILTRKDGLISEHVTDVAFSGNDTVVATPAGITFMDRDGARSLYGFQGLVNNHVYSLGVSAGDDKTQEILAGTLGGISILKNESVSQNLTTKNSALKHNWITSIATVGPGSFQAQRRWMVGTYGAGVMMLDRDGRFTAMEGVTGPMVVNPNAMLATRDHIFAGTLSNGLWSWSRATERWTNLTTGLPSDNVTAIAEQDGEVYVGTENGLARIAERLVP
jgi:hypothetical protein